MSYFVFFFFQAEDGIRDIGVTGVQTCALPIWPMLKHRACYLEMEFGKIFLNTLDRKSTRLNSSHANISYAVFCLKKKKQPSSGYYTSLVDYACVADVD